MRKTLAVLCMLTAAVGLAVGSGGFTSAAADRTVTIDVVGDENAYMALEYRDETVQREATVGDNVTVPVVTVTNQFTEEVEATVEYTVTGGPGGSAHDGRASANLSVGETTGVVTSLRCVGPGTHTFTAAFDSRAVGDGVSAETSRPRTVTYRLDCEGSTTDAQS